MTAPQTKKEIAAVGELLRSLVAEGRGEEAVGSASGTMS
jgi:hypothetical protein